MSLAGRMFAGSKAVAQREVKQIEFDGMWPWSIEAPDWYRQGLVGSSTEQAMGVPALLGVLSLIAGATAQCSALVFRDRGEDDRVRATDSWQWSLVHTRPGPPPATPSQLRADLGGSLAASGQFALRKYKARGRVAEVMVLDPRRVKPKWQNGAVVYEDSASPETEGGMTVRTSREIIYGRLFSPIGSLCGVSPITNLRRVTQAALARDDYQQRVMQNDAAPGMVYKKAGQALTNDQADEWIDRYMARHAGPFNARKPTIIGANDDIIPLPVNLRDLQFVEQNQVARETIAAAYHMPTVYIGDGARPPVYEDRFNLATFCLGPVLTAIEDTLSADTDLFPIGSQMFVEMLPEKLLRMSTRERYAAYKDARQAGWLTSNEIRAKENEPPHEDGDVLQTTPVGGAVPESAVTPATDPTLPPD